jgi:glyoxylase-like metal-dependent hydrolase (beta-lactamase superfamily II)
MRQGDLPQYEVFAVRYATVHRQRSENFIVRDAHDGPMPMDYFVWLIRGRDRQYLVDLGFNADAAKARGRQLLRSPIAGLAPLGVAPGQITDVIITHMHYDHAGNIDLVPGARLHVQEKEMQYSVSRFMTFKPLRHAYSVSDVELMVKRLYNDEIVFHDGDSRIAPGIELIHVGGHTMGLQSVRVHTARGWVVLASDASHYYDNILNEAPFPVVHDVGDMLAGHRRLMALGETPSHVIPGHDPLVMARFPRHGDPADEIVALHLAPNEPLQAAAARPQAHSHTHSHEESE